MSLVTFVHVLSATTSDESMKTLDCRLAELNYRLRIIIVGNNEFNGTDKPLHELSATLYCNFNQNHRILPFLIKGQSFSLETVHLIFVVDI